MSISVRKKKLQIGAVRRKATRCLRKGSYRLAVPHLKEQMADRDIIVNDLFNVVLSSSAKIKVEWDERYEEWRYGFFTQRFEVWTTFESPSRLVFITAIRLKRNP